MAILFCSMWYLIGWVYESLVAHAADVDLFHWVGHHFIIDIILYGCYINQTTYISIEYYNLKHYFDFTN